MTKQNQVKHKQNIFLGVLERITKLGMICLNNSVFAKKVFFQPRCCFIAVGVNINQCGVASLYHAPCIFFVSLTVKFPYK